ncbi:MAG: glycosyl transferase [Gammaproteobacteria bacterium]|nr:glycosyl transferase [Gammaproteobacteria bacterium]
MRLLYFSPVHWDSYYQRPHYMTQYFLEKNSNNKVIWVNPYPNRFPNLMDFINKRPKSPKLTPRLPNLQIISLSALPVEPLPGSEHINFQLFWKKHWNIFKEISHIGIGRPSKFALMALNRLQHQISFYDAMDDFPEFYRGLSRLSMRRVEQKVASHVNKVFVSSTALAKKFPRATKILNAYNMQTLPEAQPSRSGIFGFVGSIGQWFDWEIVLTLAKALPNNTIRLIGPCFIPCPEALPKNIEMLPECSQPEAVEHIKQFHVGLIPFKQNTLTEGIDPIKYYEYRAMGLPILSTRFGEMQYRKTEPGVYFMNTQNIQESATKALAFESSSTIIQNFRSQNDWKERFNQCEIL